MIEQVMSLKKRYDKMVKQFKEEDFKAWFMEFFALYPFITTIRWAQFTPYFNDGDSCVFSIDDPELELSASYLAANPGINLSDSTYSKKAAQDEDEDEDEWRRDWVLSTDFCDKDQAKAYPDMREAILAIEELFKAEDILLHVFGDHAEVTVTPKQIVVEEYEHD